MSAETRECFRPFARQLEARERSPLSIATYLRDLDQFAQWFEATNGAPFDTGQLTTTDLLEFKQHLRVTRNLSPATINRILASLRSFVGWCLETGRLSTEQPPQVPHGLRQVRLGPRWLDRKERLALLRAVERGGKRRDLAIVRLLLHSGLRVSELCALRWRDVRLTARKGRVVVREGKGDKRREVPLNRDARDALESLGYSEFAGTDHAVFQGQRGPLTPRAVQRVIEGYGRTAEIEEVSPHILRHTFCKNLIDAGVLLQEVAALAGHESLETTRRYCEPSLGDLERAVDKIAVHG